MVSVENVIRAIDALVAEYRKLKGENSLLKRTATLTIDMRPQNQAPLSSCEIVEVLQPAFNLLPSEAQALEHAISEDNLKEQGWVADAQGRIKHKGRIVFKIGFVSAINRVLKNIQSK